MIKRTLKRSPLFYVGDKYNLFPEIKEYFPRTINHFIEPFSGGGSVFLNVKAEEYLLNDIDKNIVNIHKFLINSAHNKSQFFYDALKVIKDYGLSRSYCEDIVPLDLKKEWKKTYYAQFNREGYNKLKKDYNNSDLKSPLNLYFLLIYGFNRILRFNSKGEFNLPVGNVDFNSNVKKALNDYFSFVKGKKIHWSNLDFKEFMKETRHEKDDFIYIDPPYLISFSEYNKLWNEKREKKQFFFSF